MDANGNGVITEYDYVEIGGQVLKNSTINQQKVLDILRNKTDNKNYSIGLYLESLKNIRLIKNSPIPQ